MHPGRFLLAAPLLALLWTGCSSAPPAEPTAETKVLRNFRLIDGNGGDPLPNAAMIVTDGRISWIGADGAVTVPEGAEVIDLAGKHVMPGIINLHGHVALTDGGLVQTSKNYTRPNVERNLSVYASYGVTSVASMGSDQDLVHEIRTEQSAARPKMARIFTAGRGFTGQAGYPTTVKGMEGIPHEIQTAEEAKQIVDGLAAQKVDYVKIWMDDHLGKEPKISMALSKAIIDAAHAHNIKVAAHVFYLADAKQLVEAGLDVLVHSVRDKPVDDELINLMKSKGAWMGAATLSRELSVFAYADAPAWLDEPFLTRSVSADVLATVKSEAYRKNVAADPHFKELPGFLKLAQQNLKRLADAGVKYGFGTDSGPPARFAGYFEHMEMELMVQAGLTPMQVIQAATKNNAEFLGQSDNLGTLQVGRWADLVVLDADPLADIRNTRSIQQVYIGGNRI